MKMLCRQTTNYFQNKITVKNRAQLNEALYKMLNTENIAGI
jgi:lipoprotein-releasing system permease protein